MFSLLGDLIADAVGILVGDTLGGSFRRAPKGERRVMAAYRDRSRGGVGGRWRHGYVRSRDDDLAWVPDRLRSVRRRLVALRGLRIVEERGPKAWEYWFISGDLTVLRCETPDGPVELAVPGDDVPFVRSTAARFRRF